MKNIERDKMKILNLYAGIGGNRKLWGGEHEITAVEINKEVAEVYTYFYPNDNLIVGDAHDYLLRHYDEFDFIWSSPPCPSHSRIRYVFRHHASDNYIYPDMNLYQEIILLQTAYKGQFCVENIIPYYPYLIKPSIVISRHAYWSNFYVPFLKIKKRDGVSSGTAKEEKERLSKNLGIIIPSDFNIDKRKALRNCVNPKIGLYILDCAMKNRLFAKKYKQNELWLPKITEYLHQKNKNSGHKR